MFKVKRLQKNGHYSTSYIDLSKCVQVDFLTIDNPLQDELGQPILDELGQPKTEVKEGVLLTFPWQVQRLMPVPVFQPGGKGKSQRFSHYKEEVMWVNYTIEIYEPDEVAELKTIYN